VAGEADPQVWITLRQDGDHWLLQVADNGVGIADEDLPRVFDPFFTTKPAGAGLGIGLAVSYAIVHELGGTLTAANQSAGALFSLRLPVDESREVQP